MTVAAPPRTPIFIDSREPHETVQVLGALLSMDAIPLQRQKLDSADFALVARDGATLGVERKTPLDFVGSLVDGRLESQLERMLAEYDHRLLVLHGRYAMTPDDHVRCGGSWSMKDTKCWYAAFQAKLLSVQGKYDTRLLVVGSDEELVVLLRTLHRQGEEGRFRL